MKAFVFVLAILFAAPAFAIGNRLVVKQVSVSRGNVQKQVIVQKNVAPVRQQVVVQKVVQQHVVAQPIVVQRVVQQQVYAQPIVVQQLQAYPQQVIQQQVQGCNAAGCQSFFAR
jgi:hypothetical protein